MKNNPKANWLLLPLVLLIWGGILYKVFAPKRSGGSGLRIPYQAISHEHANDKFALLGAYRDPFISDDAEYSEETYDDESYPGGSKPMMPMVQPKPVIAPPKFPEITYKGYIKKDIQKAFVVVAGQSKWIATGEPITGNCILTLITADSIHVSQDGLNKTYFIAKSN